VPVLDLGAVPAADHFPPASEPVDEAEACHALAMDQCRRCGLAQLSYDGTVPAEPRGVEPLALREQAAEAVRQVAEAGWLRGKTVREFGSPHGGSWSSLLPDRRFVAGTPAQVVLDSFGIMHEPDQRAAFGVRAAATAPDGVLLLQFHSLATIVRHGQWNALRHGHFAYYSLTTLVQLLDAAGMGVATAWEFDLYGGTVLIAAVHGRTEPDARVHDILSRETAMGITEPAAVSGLQHAAEQHLRRLRRRLDAEADNGHRVYAYGAASRAVSLFSRAGIGRRHLVAVADASPAKQGRRMPGTDVPIITPDELIRSDPDHVLLTVPDLYDEVHRQYPQLRGRWWVDAPGGNPSGGAERSHPTTSRGMACPVSG
jgi:hypothetical protein